MKKLFHINLNACQPKNFLLLQLLTIVFLYQLNGTKIQIFVQYLKAVAYNKNCLFGGVKLAKNADPDKYVYSGYSIGFDSCSKFSLLDDVVGKNVIIFGVDISSSVHVDNRKKEILILRIGPVQGLHDTTLTAKAQYSTNFLRSNKKLCLSLHYNKSNSFLFIKATTIYQFKTTPCV